VGKTGCAHLYSQDVWWARYALPTLRPKVEVISGTLAFWGLFQEVTASLVPYVPSFKDPNLNFSFPGTFTHARAVPSPPRVIRKGLRAMIIGAYSSLGPHKNQGDARTQPILNREYLKG
jgi:hypothetical protein